MMSPEGQLEGKNARVRDEGEHVDEDCSREIQNGALKVIWRIHFSPAFRCQEYGRTSNKTLLYDTPLALIRALKWRGKQGFQMDNRHWLQARPQ
jgi:hypothetical protein